MNTITSEPTQVYLQLRNRILSLEPANMGFTASNEAPHVWGVLMESGYEVGSATLVSLVDGTTSLYYSTGGGLLSSSEYVPVAETSKTLVAQAEIHLKHMSPTTDLPLPEVGQVRFTVLTFSGNFSADAPEEILVAGDHHLAPLFACARETLQQLRLLAEKKRKS